MGDLASSKVPSEDRPAQRSEVPKRAQKAPKADDVISTVTEDSFISFRKKFHFPNDLVMKVPARTDRACFPPPGYVTVYEFSLRAGLRFPPSSELIDILTLCGVCLSQFSYRAMSIVMGLIVLFRDRGVVLSSECLSRMGRLFSDAQGRVSFRSKWLDIRTRDPSKGWISNFFYVQNDWGLQEKWGKLKELPVPLHIGAEDLLSVDPDILPGLVKGVDQVKLTKSGPKTLSLVFNGSTWLTRGTFELLLSWKTSGSLETFCESPHDRSSPFPNQTRRQTLAGGEISGQPSLRTFQGYLRSI
ncbi:hypothetical protein IEQ34_005572 [Dendrobium chrysotoxum]|uniref:Uncharacterized protein n=1 Tax=Dendrobium chrysotoxum TaxID=161865 RepID=A0AAV7HCM4_DENCH|nr:hypothetical protein IEQ34_005572 [Dendrobium chrysotoxum]